MLRGIHLKWQIKEGETNLKGKHCFKVNKSDIKGYILCDFSYLKKPQCIHNLNSKVADYKKHGFRLNGDEGGTQKWEESEAWEGKSKKQWCRCDMHMNQFFLMNVITMYQKSTYSF